MSELVVGLLSTEDARSLTDEVKADAERLWGKLLELYEGGAHTALGYSSWGAYFEQEFGGKKSHAYRLLDSGRVLAELRHSPNGERLPASEAQARELAPLKDNPDAVREAWSEVVELHPEPTAADVREVVRRRLGVHFSSNSDEWATPQDLFDTLDAEFGFELDVCASHENHKCDVYFTQDDDGLSQEWRGTCWMNPPYSTIADWMEKAWESAKDGATVVCLVPARFGSAHWWAYGRYGQVRMLKGRLKFGNSENSAPFDSAVVIFSPDVEPDFIWWER